MKVLRTKSPGQQAAESEMYSHSVVGCNAVSLGILPRTIPAADEALTHYALIVHTVPCLGYFAGLQFCRALILPGCTQDTPDQHQH